MPGPAFRPALVELSQGSIRPAMKEDLEVEDMDLPVVDPADILTVGQTPYQLRFTTDMMVVLAGSADMRRNWTKLLQSLRDREGTVVDVSSDIMAYTNQEALKAVREGPLDVRAGHVHMVLRGQGVWPVVLSVESWLRDAVTVAETKEHQYAALTLWCLAVANVGGEEAIRNVLQHAEAWSRFDLGESACSGGGNMTIARVMVKRAFAKAEGLWTDVLLSIDRASSDVFWDWRRVDFGCRVHATGRCPAKRFELILPAIGRPVCLELVKDEKTGNCVNCGLWDHGDGEPSDDEWEELFAEVEKRHRLSRRTSIT
jgi:hypothetical protein